MRRIMMAAHTRQSRPYVGLGFQGKKIQTILVVPSSLGGRELANDRELVRVRLGNPELIEPAQHDRHDDDNTLKEVQRLLSESQGQNLALTVTQVPG